jgi:hypothetical protein
MNTPCGMAGAQCPNDATTRVRIFGVGDRCLCDEHLATITALGMDYRVLEDEPKPAWVGNVKVLTAWAPR